MKHNNHFLVISLYLIIIFIACPFYLFNPIDLYFQGDFSRTLNLLGESFYMYENISFPLFNVYNFSSPPGTNIVFTDSLPIFGLLCKIISKIIGIKFWYSPIFQLVTWCLNGFIPYLIFLKLTKDLRFSILVGIFFLFIPFHIDRFDRFPALTSHFLLFLAFYIHILDSNKKFFYYSLLIFISIGIHFYIATMTISLILFFEITKFNKKTSINIILYFIVIILSLYFYGYFLTDSPGAFPNYGLFSTNLISLFNPINESLSHSLLGSFPVSGGQYEGVSWLGFGGMIIFLFSVYFYFFKDKNKYYQVIIFLLLIFLFALTNKIYFSNILILEYPLPHFIKKFLDIWQSSGRFIWVIAYTILFYGIYGIYINFFKTFILIKDKLYLNLPIILILFLLILQIADSYTLIVNKFKYPVSINHISNGLESSLSKFKVDHFQTNYWDPQIAFSAYLLNKSTSVRYNARPLKNVNNLIYPPDKSFIEFIAMPPQHNFSGTLCSFDFDKNGWTRNILYFQNIQYSYDDMCFKYTSKISTINMTDFKIDDYLKYDNIYVISTDENLKLDYFKKYNFRNHSVYIKNRGLRYPLVNSFVSRNTSAFTRYNDNNNFIDDNVTLCKNKINNINFKFIDDNYLIHFLNINFTPNFNKLTNQYTQFFLFNDDCDDIKSIILNDNK